MMTGPFQFLALMIAGWMSRKHGAVVRYLIAENRVLRQQLGSKPLRFDGAQRRLLARRGKALRYRTLRELASIAHPDTILRWYRELIAHKYDGSARRSVGRPRVREEVRQLVVRIARDNPRWGYRRIAGAIANVGHALHRSTVQRILRNEGLLPAPERGARTRWRTFLRAHWEAIAAADFFTVEVLTLGGLRRYHVLFVIELCTRRVTIAGIHAAPYGAWMEQIARNLTDAFDGCLRDKRFLILDRDPLFTRKLRAILKSAGVDVVRLPPRSPNLNAYAERFVRSIRQECLRFIIPLGERHLRKVVAEYVAHYHLERNHQGLGNRVIDPEPQPANDNGRIVRRTRLGGLLSFYHRRSA